MVQGSRSFALRAVEGGSALAGDVMGNDQAFKIRPAGRHLLTIGRDLIQDQYAAIVELVKNAYDADSPDVRITFRSDTTKSDLTVIIEDHGHGMSRDTVINSWLVPSTSDKLTRTTSPSGRVMQGRKGIGRYSAAVLGNELLLETTHSGERTTVLLDWREFERADYLQDVDVLVETKQVDESSGTTLTILGDAGQLHQWDRHQLELLQFELRKLLSPLSGPFRKDDKASPFEIAIAVQGLPSIEDHERTIEPYPVVDLFDYRIYGDIHPDGKGLLRYECQKARNSVSEQITIDLGEPTGCGQLRYDLRVYDRDPEALDQLIARGLKDAAGEYVGRLQARKLLNELNGIGVYRNGFRIRPLGDPDFDWLELNKQRIQEPSIRIGGNQVIGLVEIEAEERSQLEEKSARDGLRNNLPFRRLKTISRRVVHELEQRRLAYRIKAGLSRTSQKVASQFEKLYELQELRKNVAARLTQSRVASETVAAIDALLANEEKDKSRVLEGIRETVAVYQGHATLGKIINVVLHEARRPLNFFKNQIPNLNFWATEFNDKKDPAALSEMLSITPGLATNAGFLVALFDRLDPLAAAKRGPARRISLRKAINASAHVFEDELLKNRIKLIVDCPDDLGLQGWEQDLYAIFTNLMDNSIFWIAQKSSAQRQITIKAEGAGGVIQFIDFRDTGPGIEPGLISSGVIFEPEFTTKPAGVGQGLGLAIAGEAASRNGLELKAIASNDGAYFRIEVVPQGGVDE